MLEIESLSVRFQRYANVTRRVDIPVLTDISLAVERGEMLAVIGASGSGKSVLAQAVLGLLPSNAESRGEIRIDGQVRTASQRRALCNRSVALVPQSLSYLDPLARCGDQIAWSARRAGQGVTEARNAINHGLSRFHLSAQVRNAFPHELSGGMARRVLLAISSAGEADLLIADEPTSGLDAANAQTVLKHLRSLADEKHAIILITHDLGSALKWADRVAIIRDGRLQTVADASAFEGDGQKLGSPYARALWQALPQNAFSLGTTP